ncbi:monooxygenase FAD-binding protein [Kribbella flavida DSM 17836]|uniref:Monooxygenase FAD-binding protein n=1 Tax=Kribbella flavida (strain DSM 17836 / JCM 10339 / NBRC 14399) TaxID=479435 RepID=D2PMT2_KRIFD|nr:FAD-dependent monooxygenase [Kribbella flavida]ADB32634.1 monooxygenase FAD-binding protein [Kribbella flavida DSM 17836]
MRRVLISGASVAGPALALWLGRAGYAVTVVELAPALRSGGYAVDFRGESQLRVLQRMGVLAELRERQTGGSPMRFVDEGGRTLLRLPPEFAGGALEVLRSDLAQVLYEHSRERAAYRFGDSVAKLEQHAKGVDVTFESGIEETYDLVVGADGLHSAVRRIAFGPERDYVRHLGYYVAGWDLPNVFGAEPEPLMYNVPGRMASFGVNARDPARAGAWVVFKSAELSYDRRDPEQHKQLVRDHFADLGWRVPELLGGLDATTDLYFDSISRVDVQRWSTGRIVLLGDAGYGATVGGMGTGTAILAAYVLAGELATQPDQGAAFSAYERLLRKPVRSTQQGGDRTGKFLAPGTRFGIAARNRLMSTPLLLNSMLKVGEKISGGIPVPQYPLAAANPRPSPGRSSAGGRGRPTGSGTA